MCACVCVCVTERVGEDRRESAGQAERRGRQCRRDTGTAVQTRSRQLTRHRKRERGGVTKVVETTQGPPPAAKRRLFRTFSAPKSHIRSTRSCALSMEKISADTATQRAHGEEREGTRGAVGNAHLFAAPAPLRPCFGAKCRCGLSPRHAGAGQRAGGRAERRSQAGRRGGAVLPARARAEKGRASGGCLEQGLQRVPLTGPLLRRLFSPPPLSRPASAAAAPCCAWATECAPNAEGQRAGAREKRHRRRCAFCTSSVHPIPVRRARPAAQLTQRRSDGPAPSSAPPVGTAFNKLHLSILPCASSAPLSLVLKARPSCRARAQRRRLTFRCR